jgi:hypothetical protein
VRAGNIARVAGGALMVHLSFVLQSLRGTASLWGSFSAGDAGTISLGTPFAAMGPVLQWTGFLALAAGLLLWILTASTAVPLTARRAAVGSPA